jgi:hypothetical protein
VIPLLQRRGLFRTAYEGKTLRDHQSPASRAAARAPRAANPPPRRRAR